MKFSQNCKNNLLKAQEEAKDLRHQKVEPEHILWLELKINEAKLTDFVEKKGVSKSHFQGLIKERMSELPRVAGSGTREASDRMKSVFSKAESGGEEISWENLVASSLEIENDPLTEVIWDAALAPFEYKDFIKGEVEIAKMSNVELAESNTDDVLSKYCSDLVKLAENGKLNPVIGRQQEIRQITTILTQKMTNNPILVGDPGVGKTQIVEGLALKIANGEGGPILEGKKILSLDVGSLLAGATYRGEFEERLKSIIKELAKAQGQIILFVDEIHTLMGAGQTSGAMDAANLIKPPLARGELWVIGATTYAEYRKHIEKDPAFTRRFVRVNVGEPTEDETLDILKGIRERFSDHHDTAIEDEQLRLIISLSGKYIGDNQFPAKAIQMLDNTLARVRLAHVLGEKEGKTVTNFDVAEAIGDKTGIPVDRLFKDESERLLNLEKLLRADLVGQDHAISTLSDRLRIMTMPFRDTNKPRGIFFFVGPSGVGKTEMAKRLAIELFASKQQFLRIDLSEYSDEHSAKKLIGSDPGLVGYEEGGILTEAIRRRPYSLVLLDEIDKAHKKVLQLFLQVFDDGRLTDNQGNTINFSNTLFILTSNHGYSGFKDTMVLDEDKLVERALDHIKHHIGPEFIKRIDEIIPFKFLEEKGVLELVDRKIKAYEASFSKAPGAKPLTIKLTESAKKLIVDQGFQKEYGARSVTNHIDTTLASIMAKGILEKRQETGGMFFPELIEVDAIEENLDVKIIN